MKKLIFLFMLLPCIAGAQNYLFEIEPQGNGTFRVLVTDDTREAYPRDITDFGTVDTAALQLLAYQRIESAKSRESSLMAQVFYAQLNAIQTEAAISNFVSIDYDAWASAQWDTAFEGNYTYTTRDGSNSINAKIEGLQLKRKSNGNVLLTLVPQAANFLIATTTGANPVTFNLHQFGDFWVGVKPNGRIVTLKKL